MPPLLILTKKTPWYGGHSGYYEQLPRHLATASPAPLRTITPSRNLPNRILGRLWSALRHLPPRDQSLTAAELRLLLHLRLHPRSPALVLNIEDHLPLLSHWPRKAPPRLIGVIHFPASQWRDPARLALLGRLSSAIILYQADIPFFETHIGPGRVHYIPHGADTTFFTPPAHPPDPGLPPRILFCGQFGRDFATLARIIPALHTLRPQLQFHLIIAPHAHHLPPIQSLLAHPAVTLHHNLTDHQLLQHHHRSTLLLLPMTESGANNTIIEALSTGLPIVTTDTGGIRDYGGGHLFPLAPQGDDHTLIRHTLHLLDHPQLRHHTSQAQTHFARTHLPWPAIAHLHHQTITHLAQTPS